MRPPVAVAIGNFDGVHRGHCALLAKVREYALQNELQSAVLTFDPHPTVVVAPDRVPLMLTSLPERLRLLRETGVDHVEVLPFTRDTAALDPRGFVSQILCGSLNARAVFVGENFRFGARKQGSTAMLEALGGEFGFASQFLSPVRFRGEIVSSSAIRCHLSEGRVNRANHLLGRPFALSGLVVSGHGIGSKQTVPTLNLRPDPALLVPRGVFITETVDRSSGRRWQSITNAGTRPTFNGDELTVETFLLSPFTPPAPAEISVEFRRYVRPERAFPDPAALRDQILRDVARANAYWRCWSYLQKRAASIY